MIMFRKTPTTTTAGETEVISPGTKEYFRGRQRNRVYEAVFKRFAQLAADDEVTRAEIARKLGKRPEQITRWLSGPGNWELDTVSDLLLAMGAELDFGTIALDERSTPNYSHPLCAITGQHIREVEQSGIGSGTLIAAE